MPSYRVFRLKENLRQQFRWAPHLSGVTGLKPKDYEEAFSLEAASPYAAWHAVKGTEQELLVGDVLATAAEEVRILKYIGFEQATWIIPEARPTPSGASLPPNGNQPDAAALG